MKKIIILLLTITMVMGIVLPVVQADNTQITVTINDQQIQFDQPPVIIDGRTLVPLRAIFEGLGANVRWNDKEKEIIALKGYNIICLKIGENVLFTNFKPVTLDVSAQIINDRTLVPVRAISEALNCKVNWDEKSKTVKIENSILRVKEIEKFEKNDNKTTKWTFSYEDADCEMIGYLNGSKYFKCAYDNEGKLVYEENGNGEPVSQDEFSFLGYEYPNNIYEVYNNATVIGNGNRVFFKDKGDGNWEKYTFDNGENKIINEYYNSELNSKGTYTILYNENNEFIELVKENTKGETTAIEATLKIEYDENRNITSMEHSNGNRTTITYEKSKRYPGVIYNQVYMNGINSLSEWH